MLCQREEREAGRAYPRTCPTCKLGPCQKLGAKPLQSLADAQAEISSLTAELDLERQHHVNTNMLWGMDRDMIIMLTDERDTALAELARLREQMKDREYD